MIEGITVTIIGGLFLFFFAAYFKHRSDISRLKADNSALLNKKYESENTTMNILTDKDKTIFDLKTQNAESQKVILSLEARVKPCDDRDVILADYTCDYSFGFWRHNSNPQNILCEPCIKKNPPIQGQVIPFGSTEFKCKVCKEHYYKDNPDQTPPPAVNWLTR